MRRRLNISMALAILIVTLFSLGCAGTYNLAECEGINADSFCRSNPSYYERLGW